MVVYAGFQRKLLAIELKEHKEKRSKLNQKIADLEDRERESVEGLKNLVETCKPFVESLDLSEADFGNTIGKFFQLSIVDYKFLNV